MHRKLAAICASLVLGSTAVFSQVPQVDAAGGSSDVHAVTAADLEMFVTPLVRGQLAKRRIAGAVVVVVKDGAVVFTDEFGLADVAAKRPMRADTLMRVGSMTKTISALAVMQLVESGKLALDRDVNECIGSVVPASSGRAPVTLRRLLSHLAGFEDRRGGIGAESGNRLPLGPFVASHMPPRLEQSDDLVAYANFDATLAAACIERASGQTYERYVGEYVFQPLLMTGTTVEQPVPVTLVSRVSDGYIRADLPPTLVSMATATIHEIGSTGMSTTGTDMGRLMLDLLASDPRLVSHASLERMMAPQARVPRGFVGLGMYSPVALGGNPFIGHDGDTGSFHSTLALLPAERFGVFASYNSDGMPDTIPAPAELLQQLAARYFPHARVSLRADSTPREGAYQPIRRVDSNVFALRALLDQLSVRRGQNGGLLLGRAAIPVGSVRLDDVEPGLFRGAGLDASFAESPSGTIMQLGAPVLLYIRVPWWASASVVMPALATCLAVASVAVISWPLAAIRKRREQGQTAGQTRRVIRLTLLLYLVAVSAALWLVLWGWPLAALSSPIVTPLALVIYAAAWSAVVLTPIAVWRAVQEVLLGVGGMWGHARDILLAAVVVILGAFSVYWRVAGTTLSF